MNKTLLVIKREYLTRVRKRSFIIISLIGPLIFLLLMVGPSLLASLKGDDKVVQVVDESGLFADGLETKGEISFELSTSKGSSLQTYKDGLEESDYYALLFVPKSATADKPENITVYSGKSISAFLKKQIENSVEKELELIKLKRSGLTQERLDELKTRVSIRTVSLNGDEEKEQSSVVGSILGLLSGLAVYFFIFFFGAQVMRSVLEEKTNRIVEVIISSVKPFNLLLGKIAGVGLVALTQVGIWLVLMTALFYVGGSLFDLDASSAQNLEVLQTEGGTNAAGLNPEELIGKGGEGDKIKEYYAAFRTMNLPLIAFSFVFFFLTSYLFYGALYAAAGAAASTETDTQQFMLPLSAPLLIAVMVAGLVAKEPDGVVAFWGSVIPFTSPIIMMLRLPVGVPMWELALSMALMLLSCFPAIWVAARIYRVGILMQGKKPTWKELSKWLFYR